MVLGDDPGKKEHAGSFRSVPVFIGTFESPIVEGINQEMDNYVKWWNSTAASRTMDPFEFACMAHYKFVGANILHSIVELIQATMNFTWLGLYPSIH